MPKKHGEQKGGGGGKDEEGKVRSQPQDWVNCEESSRQQQREALSTNSLGRKPKPPPVPTRTVASLSLQRRPKK